MEPGSRRRTAVMVIKVWLNPEGQQSFFARITESTEIGEIGPTANIYTDSDQILRHVERWLTELDG